MMPIHFYRPEVLLWLWLVPALALLFARAAIRRRHAARAFGAGMAMAGRKREAFAGCATVALVVVALARPAWNLKELQMQETGRDVIFLLDVSRSMLAEDLHPNRLENAKLAILDCLEGLAGDRVALVLFAGSAEIRCPLTVDYDYFRMALRQASPDSVASGGTMIAHAIERTVDKLLSAEKSGMQDVILITDGEDLVEGPDEVEAARMLDASRVRLVAIGIGDRTRGSRIAVEDAATGARTFVRDGNTEVWTRLHAEALRRMADAVGDGVYFEVADGPFDLPSIYRQVMENAQRSETGSQTMEAYEEQFTLFIGTALLVQLSTYRWRAQ